MSALHGAEPRCGHPVRSAVAAAAGTLADAGVACARVDAEELAAHVIGVDRTRLGLVDDPGDGFLRRYRELVAARARRIPLQHLTGTAPFGPLTLRVGPGVFVPRPETESLCDWTMKTIERRGRRDDLTIVDLCTGSGALAVALARRFPHATVVGVDDSPSALDYARANAAGTSVQLVEADVTDVTLLPGLDNRVDVVVANPPYIPDGAVLEPEVADHDPHHALFGGPDGMAVVGPVVALAARWLRAGGRLAVEHDDTTAEQTAGLVAATGVFDDVESRTDLAGRPRFVTARRGERGADRA